MDVERHLAGSEADGGIWVGCCIVEQSCDGIDSGLGAAGLG